MKIELDELLEKGIISNEIANNIRSYYEQKSLTTDSPNRLLLGFGILGALLVGLGILLIIGHNWDSFPHYVRVSLSLLPLILSQVLAAIALFKKPESSVWREASGILLVLSIGGCIALLSQIYQMGGSMTSFLLTWLLLALPVIYILRSSVASLLFIGLLTFYGYDTAYWNYNWYYFLLYWGLLISVIPFYYLLYKKQPNSSGFNFHSWAFALTVLTCFGGFARSTEGEWMLPAYMSLLGIYFLIGYLPIFAKKTTINNGFWLIGLLGMMGFALFFSYHWSWDEISRQKGVLSSSILGEVSFWVAMITTLALVAIGLFLYTRKNLIYNNLYYFSILPILFLGFFILAATQQASLATLLVNIVVFVLGVLTVLQGSRANHLGILNFGMLIVSVLIFCRFFDSDWSFVIRGVLFLLIGMGFFWINYKYLGKKK